MGWEDRDYNDGGGGGGGYSDYLAQPARLLSYSIPVGTYGPVTSTGTVFPPPAETSPVETPSTSPEQIAAAAVEKDA